MRDRYARTFPRPLVWSFVIGSVLLVAAFTYLFILADRDQEKWESWCRELGGTVMDSTKTNVGIGTDPATGRPITVTSTSTTYYCVADGKILGVR